MAKTLFAVSTAALIVACVAGWAAIPTSQARVAEAATVQVDTIQNDDKREADAFRALRRLFVRIQLSVQPRRTHSDMGPWTGSGLLVLEVSEPRRFHSTGVAGFTFCGFGRA